MITVLSSTDGLFLFKNSYYYYHYSVLLLSRIFFAFLLNAESNGALTKSPKDKL